MKNPVPFLRRTAIIEGVSFLVLLGIAMPLKYFANMPIAVKITGWAHGILFVIFCAALLRTKLIARWPVWRCAVVLVAGFLPFGPFLLDHRIAEWEKNESS